MVIINAPDVFTVLVWITIVLGEFIRSIYRKFDFSSCRTLKFINAVTMLSNLCFLEPSPRAIFRHQRTIFLKIYIDSCI